MAAHPVNPAHDSIPVHQLFGMPIHAVTMAQTVDLCRSAIEARRPMTISVVNAAKVVNMRRQPILRDAVLASDLTVADGMSVVWASRILRRRLPERVAGIDLFEQLLGLADRHCFAVYLLGAEQAVLDEVVRQIEQRYPRARIAGTRNGYFSDDEAHEVANGIRDAKPDMLFVAITPPKKEIFLAQWGELMDVPVCHGVGGSFDVMAGKVRRAPAAWQRLGLEWFYRLLQEPRRLWKRYFVTNSIFLWMVVAEFVGGLIHREQTDPEPHAPV